MMAKRGAANFKFKGFLEISPRTVNRKKRFLRFFYSCHVFTFFNILNFAQRFLFFKKCA